MEHGADDGDASSVRVAVRVRPLSGREKVDRCDECVSVLEADQQIVMGKNRSFTYDYVFGTYSQQSDIWRCVEPLARTSFDGYNSTVFAYGQTGSGKTYTMGSGSAVNVSPEDYGIIPQVLSYIFEQVDVRVAENPLYKAELRVRFLEIYGEEIRDLLVTLSEAGGESKVTLREAEGGEVQVVGATEEIVQDGEDCLRLLERGSLCRTTGSTLMNAHSSRSHAIFTVSMVQHIPIGSAVAGQELSDGDYETRNSYFNFVDLAGSERQKRTQAEGKRLKEGIDINKGLLALGNVISALGDDKKRGKVHVPYRDSKLTRMLQDSLGGNSRTLMLTCVSPADVNFDETLNALKYANRARNIKNKPVVNRDESSALTLELRRQVEILQAEVHRLRNPGLSESELKLASVGTDFIGKSMDFDSYGNLRNRAENAESEVARLTAELKRGKNQLDLLKEEMITAQAERDYLRLCVEDSAGGGAGGSSEERAEKASIIKDHLRTIADLQERLRSVEQERDRVLFGYGSAGFIDAPLPHPVSASAAVLAVPALIDVSGKQGADLIQRVEEEIAMETAMLKKMKDDESENDTGAMSDDSISGHVNLEGSADEETLVGLEVEASEEEADRQRVFQRRQQHLGESVQDLSHKISVKEQLVQGIRQAQDNYERMKTYYEQKMAQMVEEVRVAQSDRDRLMDEIQQLEHKIQTEGDAPSGNGRLAKLSKDLKTKEEELQSLRKKQTEMNRFMNQSKKNEGQLRILNNEITNMKRQKVDLVKKMQDERKRYEDEAKQRKREILSLKRTQQRDKQQIQRLGSQKEAQERVLKRKMEEITATKQRLKKQEQLTAQARRMKTSHGRSKGSAANQSDRDAKMLSEAVKKKAEVQQKLEQLHGERDVVAKEIEALYAQRAKLEEEFKKPISTQRSIRNVLISPVQASPMSRRNSGRLDQQLSPEEEQLIFDLEERIEACQARLEYKEEKISEMAEGGSLDDNAALIKIASAQSLPEARTLLKMLFGMAVDVKKQDQRKEQELGTLHVQVEELTDLLEQEREKKLQIKQSYEESLQRVVQSSTIGTADSSEGSPGEHSRVLLSISEERNVELRRRCEELESGFHAAEHENQLLKTRAVRDEQNMKEYQERIRNLESRLAKVATPKLSTPAKDKRTRVQASTFRSQSLQDTTRSSEFGPASWANEHDDDDDMDTGDHDSGTRYEEDVEMHDDNDTGDELQPRNERSRRDFGVDILRVEDSGADATSLTQRSGRSLITPRRTEHGDHVREEGDDGNHFYRAESPTLGSDDSSSTGASSSSIFSRLSNPTNFTGIHKNRVRESVSKRELLQSRSEKNRSRRLKDRTQTRPPLAMTPTEPTGASFGFKSAARKPQSVMEVLANIKRENESEQFTSSSGLRQPMSYATTDHSRENEGEEQFSEDIAPPPAPVDVYSRLAGQYTTSAQNKVKHPQTGRRVKTDEGDGAVESFAEPMTPDGTRAEGGREFTDDEELGDHDPLLGGSSLVEQVHEDYRERMNQLGITGTNIPTTPQGD